MSKQIVLAPLALLPGAVTPQPATLEIDLTTRIITDIRLGLEQEEKLNATEVLRIEDGKVLLPGLIDGGVTTVIDMPLNSIPPTTTVKGLECKRAEAKKIGVKSDLGFWGGIIPGNQNELVPLLTAGVKGFKCFLIESGVDEFPQGTNALILFHAELDVHTHSPAVVDPSQYKTFVGSRPPEWEITALELVLKIARRYPQLRFHIVHLSAAGAVPLIKAARADGVSNLTVETCFHYLCLKAEDIPPNATQFKCCPPIRDEANRKGLISALLDGTIDYVVSDHSPCVPELKKGDFMTAWGGVSGLGLGLSLLWTELGEEVGIRRVVDWLGQAQAKQVGLEGKKGVLAIGAAADYVVFDPAAEFEVSQETLRFKNKVSPYVGMKLRGVVERTYVGGQIAWDGSNALGSSGALL
ncbi:allantoinase [Kwoniella newhampshirensis]|uniref:Allantoinase n=1 Tax=Kwoniella newhampshirensis TaxID=1651941 RepID=A0AAW0YVM0_9TREE